MKFTRPDGTLCRESTGTENKKLATEYQDKMKAGLWSEARLGVKQDKPFSEVADLFLTEKSKDLKADTIAGYELLLDWWKDEFKSKMVRQITQDLVLKTIKTKDDGSLSGATLNRYLAVLRAVMRMAHRKYQLIETAPTFFMNKEPKCRVRFLKPDEISRLLEALPHHMQDMAAFSFATGLRQANVIKLNWSEVDLVNRIIVIGADKMKNGQEFGIPLPQAAVDILRRQVGKHQVSVFTYQGRPRKCISSDTWKAAKEKAGIENFRWHDMRHTWASTLAQAGVPDNALMALGAWETPSMVRKYAHHSTESVRSHAEIVDEKMGQVLGQRGQQTEAGQHLRLVG